MKIWQITKLNTPRRVGSFAKTCEIFFEYVSQLNNRTPVNTIWNIIKKISGKVQCPPIKELDKCKHNYKYKRNRKYVDRNNYTQFIGT